MKANKQSLSNRNLVSGFGTNDADYTTKPRINGKQVVCPFYQVWESMLARCYNPKYHLRNPTYKGCSVCEEWRFFSVFKKWMQSQEWEGMQLDKDILIDGNKLYSPDACLFVSGHVNSLLADSADICGEYPQGVSLACNKFVARCRVNGKRKHIGSFSSVDQAAQAYKEFKSNEIIRVAKMQQDHRVSSALLDRANDLSLLNNTCTPVRNGV